METPTIIVTADGSHSLLNTQLNETYHSKHGAVQESLHVFIKNGLQYVLEKYAPANLCVLEIGFGTGLNTLLTLQHALEHDCVMHYTALEPFPLSEEIWSQLNYSPTDQLAEYFQRIHKAGWMTEQLVHQRFLLTKIGQSLQESKLPEGHFDLVYFDAFAPNKQPEMWEFPVLGKAIRSLKKGGVLVTYCAKGQLKRDLKAMGCSVETLPGPPGKKEMVRATLW